jgi:hypothetical protein
MSYLWLNETSNKCGYEYSFQDLLFQALERLGGPEYKEICAQLKDEEIGNEDGGFEEPEGI